MPDPWPLIWFYFGLCLCAYASLIVLELIEDRRDEKTRLAESADQQHSWVLAGDPRGTYGEHYKPLKEVENV
jgi:hypothetical protein